MSWSSIPPGSSRLYWGWRGNAGRKLLVAKSVITAAIRALPSDAVAGHAPDIFVHAHLADTESATALPTKWEVLPAAVAFADKLAALSSFASSTMFGVQLVHPLLYDSGRKTEARCRLVV